jgi:hypothetical protein
VYVFHQEWKQGMQVAEINSLIAQSNLALSRSMRLWLIAFTTGGIATGLISQLPSQTLSTLFALDDGEARKWDNEHDFNHGTQKRNIYLRAMTISQLLKRLMKEGWKVGSTRRDVVMKLSKPGAEIGLEQEKEVDAQISRL